MTDDNPATGIPHPDDENSLDESLNSETASGGPGRKRRRKVRKRIRIKKKKSPMRKVRKVLEKIAWLLIIAAFITTLVILMKQLDLKDDKNEKKKKKSFLEPKEHFSACAAAPHFFSDSEIFIYNSQDVLLTSLAEFC